VMDMNETKEGAEHPMDLERRGLEAEKKKNDSGKTGVKRNESEGDTGKGGATSEL